MTKRLGSATELVASNIDRYLQDGGTREINPWDREWAQGLREWRRRLGLYSVNLGVLGEMLAAKGHNVAVVQWYELPIAYDEAGGDWTSRVMTGVEPDVLDSWRRAKNYQVHYPPETNEAGDD